MNEFNNKLRELKNDFKQKKAEQRALAEEIKDQHTEILKCEDKAKRLTNLIKVEKENGDTSLKNMAYAA